MKRRVVPLGRVYGLLETGPVVLLCTSKRGRHNVMTMSWHMMMEFEPPLVGCIVSNRNFSFEALKSTRECTLNIPTVEIVDAVVGCGNCSGDEIDKFAEFGLTALPAKLVDAPVIPECYASLECRVSDTRMCNRYNLFTLEVLRAVADPSCKNPRTLHHRGRGAFMIAGRSIQTRSKMR